MKKSAELLREAAKLLGVDVNDPEAMAKLEGELQTIVVNYEQDLYEQGFAKAIEMAAAELFVEHNPDLGPYAARIKALKPQRGYNWRK